MRESLKLIEIAINDSMNRRQLIGMHYVDEILAWCETVKQIQKLNRYKDRDEDLMDAIIQLHNACKHAMDL